MTCYIFGAAPMTAACPVIGEEDLVIAADGGLVHTTRFGVTPDIIIGDFDSLGHVPTGTEVVKLPVEKDMTDMAAAIQLGRARGYRRFVLLGGTGARPDHTVANYQLLAELAAHGEEGYLVDAYYSVTAISLGSTLTFDADFRGTLSVFAYGGEATGVTERGTYYTIEDVTLSPTCPTGVSNAFTGVTATVSAASGTLLVMWEGERLPKRS